MLKVAFINQDRGISPQRNKGAAVHLLAMRKAFSELGATVAAFDEPEDESLSSALAASFQESPFDLVYERYALGKSCGVRFAVDKGIPLALEVNAPLADEQNLFRGAPESREDLQSDNYLFQHADCIVAVSGAVAQYAIDRGATADKIMLCPNGVDTQRFNLKVDTGAIKARYVPADAFVLGFHGRQRPWHGFGHLVDVFQKLLERKLRVHLLVIGEGEFHELGALPAANYTRLGWQDHALMPELVATFDALPLTYQPGLPCYFSPLKLMEAMACGVVPVVPDLGDLAKVVKHGQTGLVYAPGNQNELESLLAGLILDAQQRTALGKRAAVEASNHSWQRIATRVMERLKAPTGHPVRETG